MFKFYCYSKCGTCKKAEKFLKEKNAAYDSLDIVTTKFTKEDIKNLHIKSKKDIKKLFNTSGNAYKELNLKERLHKMSLDESYEILTTNGMLLKRPILVSDTLVAFGFSESEYEDIIKNASRN